MVRLELANCPPNNLSGSCVKQISSGIPSAITMQVLDGEISSFTWSTLHWAIIGQVSNIDAMRQAF